ncbi:hypothetical protein MRX96_016146 [Rhipicephalus microplus]
MPRHKPPTRHGSLPRSSSLTKRGSRSSLDSGKSRLSLYSDHLVRKHSQPTAGDSGKVVGHVAAALDQDQKTTDAPHRPGPHTIAVPVTTATTDVAAHLAQHQGSTRRLSLVVEPTHGHAPDEKRPARHDSKTSHLNTAASKTHHDLKNDIDEPATTTRRPTWMAYMTAQGGFKTVVIVVMLSAIVLLLVGLVLLRLYMRGTETTTPRRPFAVCNTTDCVAHAATLSASVASARDPCDDFSRFVCAAWKRDHMAAVKSLTEQVEYDFTRCPPVIRVRCPSLSPPKIMMGKRV